MAEAQSTLEPRCRIRLWREDTHCGRPEGDFQPYLDCFPHPGGGVRGGILICPGGAYCGRAPHEGVDIAERFNQLGFHAFVLQYRVQPYVYPAPQLDALRAMKILRSRAREWNLAPDQLALCGFSAGGHLAASVGVLYDRLQAEDGDEADRESARPDALVLGYPVISFDRTWGHRGSGEWLLADRLEELEEQLKLNLLVTAETPPTFLWHTAADAAVPVENSLYFAEALSRNRVKFALHVFPEGAHGLGLAPELPEVRRWPELCRDFLKHNCRFCCGN